MKLGLYIDGFTVYLDNFTLILHVTLMMFLYDRLEMIDYKEQVQEECKSVFKKTCS